jgi:hypothetical protein
VTPNKSLDRTRGEYGVKPKPRRARRSTQPLSARFVARRTSVQGRFFPLTVRFRVSGSAEPDVLERLRAVWTLWSRLVRRGSAT